MLSWMGVRWNDWLPLPWRHTVDDDDDCSTLTHMYCTLYRERDKDGEGHFIGFLITHTLYNIVLRFDFPFGGGGEGKKKEEEEIGLRITQTWFSKEKERKKRFSFPPRSFVYSGSSSVWFVHSHPLTHSLDDDRISRRRRLHMQLEPCYSHSKFRLLLLCRCI